MVRKLWAAALAFLMLMGAMPLTAAAEAAPPTAFGAPEHFAVSHYMVDSVYYTFSAPADMRAYIERCMADDPDKQTFSINFQIDYKIDGGGWHHTSAWDSPATAPDGISDRYLVFSGGRYYHSSDRWGLTDFFPEEEALNTFYEIGWDYLKSHSITFRARFAESYDGGESYVLSPWSKEYTLSANGKADYNKLINHAPILLSAEVKTRGSEPYFDVKTGVIPDEIQDLNAMSGGAMGVQIWMRRAGEADFKKIEPSDPLAEALDVEASEYFDDGQQSYDQESYEIKVRYELDLRSYKQSGYADSAASVYIYSPFSNVISHNMPAWSDASAWATEELKKADDAGLIPGILKGADLTKPITREEFCELALLLYEKTTGESPAPISPNPFTDTKNLQILKAFSLGITQGTSATTFSPQVLISREQCATMLFRAIKAIHPKGDYSVAGVPDFPDQKNISSFAVEGTKFMSKLGIIKGDNNGNFMPKATTTAQTAAGYGMATREAAVLMSVRTYDRMDDIQSS